MAVGPSEQAAFEARMRRQIEAYHEAALIYAAVKLRLPERLEDQPRTADDLAEKLGLSAPLLHRLLRGLVALGICEELPAGAFVLTEAGLSLKAGAPSRLAEKATIVVEQYWRPWAELTAALETGRPAFEQAFGRDVRDWRRANAEQGALFAAYLTQETHLPAKPIADALDLAGVGTVAEIGGSHGGLLAAVLEAHPHVSGVLLDEPHVLIAAAPFFQSLGLAERVHLVGGDALVAVTVTADLYLQKGVLQNFDDARAAAVLRNCRAAMRGAARLAVIERLMPDRASEDASAILLDLHMMAITGGRLRRRDEIEALLAEAGFPSVNATPLGSGLTLFETR
jgi:O-methyltransferase domain